MCCDRPSRLIADSPTSSTVDNISASGLDTKPEMNDGAVELVNAVGALTLDTANSEVRPRV